MKHLKLLKEKNRNDYERTSLAIGRARFTYVHQKDT